MSYRKINLWQQLDWWCIALYLLLVITGWFSIYGASYDFDHVGLFDLSGRSGLQMIWILTSLVLGFVILMIDKNWYDIFAFWLYTFIILLLILTIFVAPDIKGSRSWLVVGPINIQPAEFSKFATALALSKLLDTYKLDIHDLKKFSIILGLIFLPSLLILLQQETGSALVYLAFFCVLYREGMSGKWLLAGFCSILFFIINVKYSETMIGHTNMGEFIVLSLIIVILLGLLYSTKEGKSHINYLLMSLFGILLITMGVTLFFQFDLSTVALVIIGLFVVYLLWLSSKKWSRYYAFIFIVAFSSIAFLYSVDYVFHELLEPHHQVRIQVALGIKDDPSGVSYNVNQSKIAIGSGGFWGKGFLNGTQTKLKYVPEQDTDFIFCTVGEEEGFWGSSLILCLFLFLIIRLIILAERQRSTFNRVYGYSVASIIFIHVAINIGMVIGISPVIGIPLPFFSYGGSSIWAFTILLFIFLRLDASRRENL